jgi:hypothetical protein
MLRRRSAHRAETDSRKRGTDGNFVPPAEAKLGTGTQTARVKSGILCEQMTAAQTAAVT